MFYIETYKTIYFDCLLRDNLVLTKSGAAEFRFRLAGVQLSDRGYYWCDVTAWTKQQPGQAWTKASSSESNKIRINFLENGEFSKISTLLYLKWFSDDLPFKVASLGSLQHFYNGCWL